MQKQLHLSSPDYQWLLTIFYIAYILFEWLILMWKVVPPHIWAAICVTGFGIVATLQSATYSFTGMMIARFFLGMFEAGFGPAFPLYLSYFYLRHEIGLRLGFIISAAPLATCFAGVLAYGITSGDGSKVANWRLLFLVEGLPSIVAGIITFFTLPDSPSTATFLNHEDKLVARTRGIRQVGSQSDHRIGKIVWADVLAALLDLKNYFTALMYFSCNVSFSSLPVFLPTILKEMGFSAINAQGLTAPPFFLSFLITILTPWIADRTQQRGLMLIVLTIIGGIGYTILAAAKSVGARYFGVFMAAAGIFPAIANILPWVLNNQGSDTRRGAGIVVLNLIGQCGPLLGTRLYPSKEGPFYVKGQAVCAAFMFFTTLLVITLRTLLAWENKKLDRKHGTVAQQKQAMHEAEARGEGKQEIAVENYGPLFRYVL